MSDEQQKNISDDTKFSRLPDHVYSWLFSTEASTEIRELAKNFNLEEEKIPILAKIVGQIILKEILLEKFPVAIKEFLKLNDENARKLSISAAIKEFLPIRDYLKDIEKLIALWGGTLPAELPPIFKAKTAFPPNKETSFEKSSSMNISINLIQKSLRQIVQENKEILNQIITTSPLKVADFDQPVRGTIKNWLADYVNKKGAARHDQMERGDYLFKGTNSKNLSPQEKLIVAEIFKSYDENSTLDYDKERKLIIFDNLEKNSQIAPENSANPAREERSSSVYREPIEEKDLAKETILPLKKTLQTQIGGPIINLKDFQ